MSSSGSFSLTEMFSVDIKQIFLLAKIRSQVTPIHMCS